MAFSIFYIADVSILYIFYYTSKDNKRNSCVYFWSWRFSREKKKDKKGIVFICELRRSPLDTLKYNKHDSSKGILGKKHLAQKAYLKIYYKFKGHENAP